MYNRKGRPPIPDKKNGRQLFAAALDNHVDPAGESQLMLPLAEAGAFSRTGRGFAQGPGYRLQIRLYLF